MKYALIVDDNTQWISKLISLDVDDSIMESFDLTLDNDFINNLRNRGLSFTGKQFYTNYRTLFEGRTVFHGWYISHFEFNKIKRILELKKYVDEYNHLSTLN